MNIKQITGRAVAAVAVVAVLSTGGATAATLVTPSDNTVTSAKIVTGGVWGTDIQPNTIGEDKLGQVVRQKLNKVGTGAPGAKGDKGDKGDTGAASTVAGPKGDKGDPGAAATDVKGSVVLDETLATTTVDNIGGTFSTKATLIDIITLPAGKLKIDADGFWTTLAVGPAGTRPQLALRGTGVSVTIFPGEASPAKDRELTGHATKVVTLTEPTEVKVWAFGYNDDTSANGGGRLAVTASVVASVG